MLQKWMEAQVPEFQRETTVMENGRKTPGEVSYDVSGVYVAKMHVSHDNKKQKWNGQCFIPHNMEAQRSKSHFWRKLAPFLSVPDNSSPKHHELITYLKCSYTPMFDAQQWEGGQAASRLL